VPRGVVETKRALIVVRTYPIPAKSSIEASCTAAITDESNWLRLFPVPWRLLAADKRFRRYQWVEVSVVKARDHRPESYRLNDDGIRIISEPLSTANAWRARKDVIFPLRRHCLCCIARARDEQRYPTLGIFQPKTIERLIIRPDGSAWISAQLMALRQMQIWGKAPTSELEKVPFAFFTDFGAIMSSAPVMS